jgi:FlaA1/EpsC-like NDP-sugar epimerase
VIGRLEKLDELITKHRAEGLVIALAEAASSTIRRVVATAKERGLETKIVPGLHEIIGGNVSVSRLRDVEIEDLLGRDAVQLDSEAVGAFVRRKVVAVTGAGGSIGSELSRQLAGFGPSRLLLIERAEPALFEIHRELSAAYPALHIEPCLADVTVPERMRAVLTAHGCDAIFHAAAHKHVPMIEWNPSEAIRNNVLGTKCLADLAADLGVGHFVLISTDKAINPTSVMGASKRVAELYVQAMGRSNRGTSFVSVRFGNVLGSAGSVVPIFKRQIAKGGPVTVTHPDMLRYFMTIPEASQLVLQAAALGKGGEVFVLDMGEPVRIVDLARDLIRLSGLQPDRDIEIRFSGTRPGEKLFEELTTDEEQADKTTHRKIFVGRVREVELKVLNLSLIQLQESMLSPDPAAIYSALRKLIPEFSGERSEQTVTRLKVVE